MRLFVSSVPVLCLIWNQKINSWCRYLVFIFTKKENKALRREENCFDKTPVFTFRLVLDCFKHVYKVDARLSVQKRCGVQDVATGFRNRKKRYSLQGTGTVNTGVVDLGHFFKNLNSVRNRLLSRVTYCFLILESSNIK